MYGGMYGSSNSAHCHKRDKLHHAQSTSSRQRQFQQNGCAFLASRSAELALSTNTNLCTRKQSVSCPGQQQARRRASLASGLVNNRENVVGLPPARGLEVSTDGNRTVDTDAQVDLDKCIAVGSAEIQDDRTHVNPLSRLLNFVRRTWMEFTTTEDSELDELEGPTVHYKPEAIETLCQLTKFNRRELQLMYRGFKQECPSGMVKEETFKMIYSQFFPRGADASQYAHFVFNTFDQDNTGAITFTDFVIGLSVLSRGSLQEKLRWTFNLYDINGDGYITKDELSRIVKAVYDLMGRAVEPLVEEHTTREHVERVFNRLDLNKDGVVTIDEFMDSCTKDENISKSMAVLDTIL